MFAKSIRPLPGERIDWKAERDRIDLAELATRLLGPAPGQRGTPRGSLRWNCPFHDDRNPSFSITPGKPTWKCWGCGERGDAASLVMKLEGMTFPRRSPVWPPEPFVKGIRGPKPNPRPPSPATTQKGLALDDALFPSWKPPPWRSWSPEGAEALAYLGGPARCLTEGTMPIVPTRLDVTGTGGRLDAPGDRDPWFDGDRLAMAKIHLPNAFRGTFPKERRPPKYLEAYRDSTRLNCYPSLDTIRPGRPLILVEGEIDALLLGQELGASASVITLGSTSMQPTTSIRIRAFSAPAWYAAHDKDPAGEKAAGKCPARYRRIHPRGPSRIGPKPGAAGVDLARWWPDALARLEPPTLFTWDDLSRTAMGTGRWRSDARDRLPVGSTDTLLD